VFYEQYDCFLCVHVPYLTQATSRAYISRNNQVLANIFLYVVINAAVNHEEKRSIETLIYKLDEIEHERVGEGWKSDHIESGFECGCIDFSVELNEYFMRHNTW
jgi:hypothetical protein